MWLSSVSNASICTWFYVMFILNCIVAVVMLMRTIFLINSRKPGFGPGSLIFILTLVSLIIPVVNGAFFYALCDRSLGSESVPTVPTVPTTATPTSTFGNGYY
jgi:hypothetical protein